MSIHSLMSLKGRRALITGAGGHLGEYIAGALGELGCDLVLVDRPGALYEQKHADFKGNENSQVEYHECDLELENQRSELIDNIIAGPNPLDILIHNAAFVGTSALEGWSAPFADQSLQTWRRAMEVNLTAAFHLTQGLEEKLKQQGKGSVIHIGSIYGVNAPDYTLYKGTGIYNPAGYAASKGGLVHLTRWLASSLAPAIRVNAISPGGIKRGQPEEFIQRYETKTPLGRMASEEDIKGAVAYLASDLSAYVTGQNLLVDGGWSIV